MSVIPAVVIKPIFSVCHITYAPFYCTSCSDSDYALVRRCWKSVLSRRGENKYLFTRIVSNLFTLTPNFWLVLGQSVSARLFSVLRRNFCPTDLYQMNESFSSSIKNLFWKMQSNSIENRLTASLYICRVNYCFTEAFLSDFRCPSCWHARHLLH